MNPALPLRLALACNALFSMVTALAMLWRTAMVGAWLGSPSLVMLQLIGVGLLLFAAELLYQATRPRVATWRALLASAADFSWVLGTLLLLIVFPQSFSPLGNTLVMVVAGVVACFGTWQLWAAGHAHRTDKDGEYRHCIMVETNVPADEMWQVVSNIADIQKYMPSLKSSTVLNGRRPSVGAIRACENHAGATWAEEVTEFNPGRDFTVRFLADDPAFPFPAKAMIGGWEVIPTSVGSQVVVWWKLTLRRPILAPVILPLLAFQVDRDFPQVVRRMADVALEANGDDPFHSKSLGFARLLPRIC